MKSKQPDNLYQTACKDCLFAVYDGNTQTDCSMGRIEKWREKDAVIEAYDNDKEFFVINGVCNTVRQGNWNGGVADTELVRKEVVPTFEVFIVADHLSKDTVDEILKLHDEATTCHWTVLASFDLPAEVKHSIVSPLAKGLKADIVECADAPFTIGTLSLKSRRSFTVVLDHLSLVSSELFTRVDTLLNDDMDKFVVYNLNGTEAVSNLALHVMHHKLETYNFNHLCDAVRDYAKEQNLTVTEVK